jgi:hypothetical protein
MDPTGSKAESDCQNLNNSHADQPSLREHAKSSKNRSRAKRSHNYPWP